MAIDQLFSQTRLRKGGEQTCLHAPNTCYTMASANDCMPLRDVAGCGRYNPSPDLVFNKSAAFSKRPTRTDSAPSATAYSHSLSLESLRRKRGAKDVVGKAEAHCTQSGAKLTSSGRYNNLIRCQRGPFLPRFTDLLQREKTPGGLHDSASLLALPIPASLSSVVEGRERTNV